MNLRKPIALASIVLASTPFVVADDYHARTGSAATDNWNDAVATRKWSLPGTFSPTAAASGNVYHTNGQNIRAGHIGTVSGPGTTSVFAGDKLVVNGYNAAVGFGTATAATGVLTFELGTGLVGPKASPTGYTRGTYTANIETALNSGSVVAAGNASGSSGLQLIQGTTGVTTLNGTLTLHGDTRFRSLGSQTDVLFNVNSAVSGTGRIELGLGTAPNAANLNGSVTFGFNNLNSWSGNLISVTDRYTIGFTDDTDFLTNNPAAVINFGVTQPGFLNLQADVWFSSGNVFINNTPLADGVYTVSALNALFGASDFYDGADYFASEGIDFSAIGTTYKLHVGAIPEPSTYAAMFGALAFGVILFQRRKRRTSSKGGMA